MKLTKDEIKPDYKTCPRCGGDDLMCNGHRTMCLDCDWDSDKR
jgi:ribosomal protein S27AE